MRPAPTPKLGYINCEGQAQGLICSCIQVHFTGVCGLPAVLPICVRNAGENFISLLLVCSTPVLKVCRSV